DGRRGGKVAFEDGISEKVSSRLASMGHDLIPITFGHARSVFGRAQIIKRDPGNGVLWAGWKRRRTRHWVLRINV
ncbi:MAG: hypothetical protein ACREBR_00550, partial [bacterium]